MNAFFQMLSVEIEFQNSLQKYLRIYLKNKSMICFEIDINLN